MRSVSAAAVPDSTLRALHAELLVHRCKALQEPLAWPVLLQSPPKHLAAAAATAATEGGATSPCREFFNGPPPPFKLWMSVSQCGY